MEGLPPRPGQAEGTRPGGRGLGWAGWRWCGRTRGWSAGPEAKEWGPGVGAGGLPSLDSQVTGSRAHSSHLMAWSRKEWGRQTQASSSEGALPHCPCCRQPLWPWAGAQGRVLACPSRLHCLMAPPGLSGLAFSCFSSAQIPSLPWGSTPMAATPNTQASLRGLEQMGSSCSRSLGTAEARVMQEEVRGWPRAGLVCLSA